ncbi:ribonuclease P protein component [Haloactinomyces albus]|uniref:ribonuclease P protein component n=1 Tax=Haloactinomyces albus TaxID=1352928 RepID=UPI00286CD9AA|nr:ribonuclease P protein component [Haloactinomyces albus]
MLPAAARLTRSQDFSLVVRRGRRAGRSRLVVHVLTQPGGTEAAPARATECCSDGASLRNGGAHRSGTASATEAAPIRERDESPRVGFVVSKAVGNAVMRHRVARRLRHLMRERLGGLPPGTLVVVRALPPAAGATSRDLGRDLDSAFRKLRVSTASEGLPPTENT